MVTMQQRINAFSELGLILKDAASDSPSSTEAISLRHLMDNQEKHNRWFTPDNVNMSVRAIANMLEKDKLEAWLKPYAISDDPVIMKTIAVIMAGNIPLVGFHDFMSVLISGNILLARTSKKDNKLIVKLADILTGIDHGAGERIRFTDKISGNYDAVIATGSNNTSRYFEYYFGQKHHIFRKNRNSVAIIDRNITNEDLGKLGNDIYSYFGLGCRNVSKLYIEESINPEEIFSAWSDWSHLLNHRPYLNNYLYNRSLFRLNKQHFLDNGFMLFKQETVLSSPVAVTYFEFFSDREQLANKLRMQSGMIQCIVSEKDTVFGHTQYPEPDEYADNMDTLEFINSLQ